MLMRRGLSLVSFFPWREKKKMMIVIDMEDVVVEDEGTCMREDRTEGLLLLLFGVVCWIEPREPDHLSDDLRDNGWRWMICFASCLLASLLGCLRSLSAVGRLAGSLVRSNVTTDWSSSEYLGGSGSIFALTIFMASAYLLVASKGRRSAHI